MTLNIITVTFCALQYAPLQSLWLLKLNCTVAHTDPGRWTNRAVTGATGVAKHFNNAFWHRVTSTPHSSHVSDLFFFSCKALKLLHLTFICCCTVSKAHDVMTSGRVDTAS